MPIYFSRPKNAGEAFRRIAQSVGGKNISELKTNEIEVIDGVKQATRCYDNGVKIVSRGEAVVVADENKVIMAKTHTKDRGQIIRKFFRGKLKTRILRYDFNGNWMPLLPLKNLKETATQIIDILRKNIKLPAGQSFNFDKLFKFIK